MSTLRIEKHKDFALNVTAKYSDKHTGLVHVKLEHDYISEGVTGTSEMFLTFEEMRDLADFFNRAAVEAELEHNDAQGIEVF